MKVATASPFQLIYSILTHEYLGYLFESFVIQLDSKGHLTLLHQNISSKNAQEFASGLDLIDYEIIDLIDSMQQEVVMKKFCTKKMLLADFFEKTYDEKKGDKALQEAIENYLEIRRAKILDLTEGKKLFIMGKDGNPAWKEVEIAPQKASVLFHFRKNEENTHYFPTIKHEGEKLEFQYKDALIICNHPAWMLLGNKLYHFTKEVDGKKIKPFLNKKFIVIPKNLEETYYEKFVLPLVASFDVYAKGFEIKSEKYNPVAVLTLVEANIPIPTTLFEAEVEKEEEEKITFHFKFQYGDFSFKADNLGVSHVSLEKEQDNYIFHKVKRDENFEKSKLALLKNLGLEIKNAKVTLPKDQALKWLHASLEILQQEEIIIEQNIKNNKKYFIGKPSIEVKIQEKNDWFDVYTKIVFGEFEIPFLKIRKLILQKKSEFTLPNGEIAFIPEEWLNQYAELLYFTEIENEDTLPRLKKHHIGIIEELQRDNLAKASLQNKLEALCKAEEIEDYPLPEGLQGELRPYQKSGYNWMCFLNQYKFGGCLADDMGLGKTIQTLTLLQAQKEKEGQSVSLIVMPTSLIYNWELEAQKFTPHLKVFAYVGSQREKNTEKFTNYDVIITSYGIVRVDIDILTKFYFNYIILDESQAIKNPTSNIFKAVMQLHAKNKLILTGTPLENTTLDLWSQINFINPGLLGTQAFFKEEYLAPIEKKHDDQKAKRLQTLIKPFILRRHKAQVATELPQKIENIQFCNMTPEQEEMYEKTKNYYREQIIAKVDKEGVAKSQFLLLKGLMQLRQIANHPLLVDKNYEGQSGKMEDVLYKLENLLNEKHKILIFSQFVKHLAILRNYLDSHNRPYAYLDGSTKDRQAEVEKFQHKNEADIFLISLKAGGLGLNLTAADYVFLLDPWWNPAIEAQAIDRAYRIGQTQTVFTYKFITKNTVEEKILALQKNKQKLANDLITTEQTLIKKLNKEDLIALLD